MGTGSALRAAHPSIAASTAALQVRATKAAFAARACAWTVAIFGRLREGDATASELADAADVIPSGTFHHHLRALERNGYIARAGLVERPHPGGGVFITTAWRLV